jgi:hypothetical protein
MQGPAASPGRARRRARTCPAAPAAAPPAPSPRAGHRPRRPAESQGGVGRAGGRAGWVGAWVGRPEAFAPTCPGHAGSTLPSASGCVRARPQPGGRRPRRGARGPSLIPPAWRAPLLRARHGRRPAPGLYCPGALGRPARAEGAVAGRAGLVCGRGRVLGVAERGCAAAGERRPRRRRRGCELRAACPRHLFADLMSATTTPVLRFNPLRELHAVCLPHLPSANLNAPPPPLPPSNPQAPL